MKYGESGPAGFLDRLPGKMIKNAFPSGQLFVEGIPGSALSENKNSFGCGLQDRNTSDVSKLKIQAKEGATKSRQA
jgi:hypothetical protein